MYIKLLNFQYLLLYLNNVGNVAGSYKCKPVIIRYQFALFFPLFKEVKVQLMNYKLVYPILMDHFVQATLSSLVLVEVFLLQ